jgi:PadR family transcriptional regulator, regulatory protein AphA
MDVRTICLGILTRGDATGYEIKKLFEDGRYSYFVEASFGSIYPALSRLTDDGLVSVRAEAGVRRPDRKVYSITEEGRRAFVSSLNSPLPDDRFRSPFLFAMMFADFLHGGRVSAMIDTYIAETESKLAQITCDCGRACNAHEAFVCEMGRTIYQSILVFLKDRKNQFNADAAKTAAE